jgi:predicted nucleotidyltransferase
MPEKNEFIAYAMDFVSYLLSKSESINRIILFGSVARGDFDEDSDIDIFVDSDEKKEKIIKVILEDYYKTKKYNEWKLKGIDNEISMIIGSLESEEWKDLKRSIMNNGIILFGKYKGEAERINHYTLFSFENIKPNKKRITIFRKLFGFKRGKKEYPGLIKKINAVKVGKGCLIVPIEKVNELKDFFISKKVSVKLYDLWSDTKIEN